MSHEIENVLTALDGFRMSDQMDYAAYSQLHDLISKLDVAEPSAREWISVNDKLPGSMPDEYLVVNGGKVQLAIFMDGMWITTHRVSSITYWMPLPEPPKEE